MNIRFAIYGALAGIALIVGAYYKGVWDEHEKYEAAAASVRKQDVAIARKMEPQIEQTLNQSHNFTTSIISEVPHVTEFYIPSPGAVSIPRPVYYLTWGSVSLWNRRLDADSASHFNEAPPGASALSLSPISFEQAETNALLNFGQYADCRIIVQQWQDWYRQVSKVKP